MNEVISISTPLISYLVDYINEELFFHNISEVSPEIIRDAIDAFNGGAR